jgi:hypothetical protein
VLYHHLGAASSLINASVKAFCPHLLMGATGEKSGEHRCWSFENLVGIDAKRGRHLVCSFGSLKFDFSPELEIRYLVRSSPAMSGVPVKARKSAFGNATNTERLS